MSNRYHKIINKIKNDEIIILDGGTGTELEKRGVVMDQSWCGTASNNTDILKQIHTDYINAGAQIITTNTYASNRVMLDAAGVGDKFEEINSKALKSAIDVRNQMNNDDLIIAGSLSHRMPIPDGHQQSDPAIKWDKNLMAETYDEMADFLTSNGCDFLLLEMMYHPDRVQLVFEAAKKTGKPIWAGFSSRKATNGKIYSQTTDTDIPFKEFVEIINSYEVDVVGIMHTSVDAISESVEIIKDIYDGPVMAYPDSGGWVSPNWDFDKVIKPNELLIKAQQWINEGVRIVGGCCGLSPEHIEVYKGLKK